MSEVKSPESTAEVAIKAGPITLGIIVVLAILETLLFLSGQSGW